MPSKNLFGEQKVELREVRAFSNPGSDIILWASLKEDADTIVLVDASGSMADHQSVLKLMASMLKCLSGTQGQWDLPHPGGGTALVDAVDNAVALLSKANFTADKGRIIVLSDGLDNTSKASQLRNGPNTYIPMPSKGEEHLKAVADHLNFSGAEMIVIGIGSEVSPLLAACNRPGRVIKTAHVTKDATAAEVGAVVKEVVRRSRDPALRGSRGRLSPSEAPNSDGTIGTVTAANAPRITDEEVAPVAAEAKQTRSAAEKNPSPKQTATKDEKQQAKDKKEAALAAYVPIIRRVRDGDPFDKHAMVRYIDTICDAEAGGDDELAHKIKGAVAWFFRFLAQHAPNNCASPALLTSRQYPAPEGKPLTEATGPIFMSPMAKVTDANGKEKLNPEWQKILGRVFYALTLDPEHDDYLRNHYPTLHTAVDTSKVGPFFIDLGRMGSHYEITAGHGLPQLKDRPKNLYFKFAPKDHMHVVRNPRAAYVRYEQGCDVGDLTVSWGGNSGGVVHLDGSRAFEERAATPVPPRSEWFKPSDGAGSSTVPPAEDSDSDDDEEDEEDEDEDEEEEEEEAEAASACYATERETNKQLKVTVADLVLSERKAKRAHAEMEISIGNLRNGLAEAMEKVEALEAKNKKLKSALDAAIA